MEQLDPKFEQILAYLINPEGTHATGDRPVCYLTYHPDQALDVKAKVGNWEARARHAGFTVATLSLARVLNDFFRSYPRRAGWKLYDQPDDWQAVEELYQDLAELVANQRVLEKAVLGAQETLQSQPQPHGGPTLLLLTDLEGIHPFTRFGPIEQRVYPSLTVPLVVLYPGKLNGSSLEFLNVYPPDGNYRSKHF